ncbi:MAG: M23 family metallopeptidase [Steroidobacteraceae bacterium]
MNLILFSGREGRAHHLNLAHPLTLAAIILLGCGILATAFLLGARFGAEPGALAANGSGFGRVLDEQRAEISALRSQLKERVDALAVRMGEVNAHIIRLDALGRRLTEMASIDPREFNFDSTPPSGGPESEDGAGASAEIPDLTQMLDDLESRVDLRYAQMSALQNVILARNLKEQIMPDGRPVTKGFISSYFGDRQDPFSGHQAFHKGVDFAGQIGDEVVAVAAGIVSWSGERAGYGWLIEINHGSGYVTRYAHNRRSLVTVGQTVTRGQPIALMGSTGRSTGPHVHFEVLKDGRQVNPMTFIGR